MSTPETAAHESPRYRVTTHAVRRYLERVEKRVESRAAGDDDDLALQKFEAAGISTDAIRRILESREQQSRSWVHRCHL